MARRSRSERVPCCVRCKTFRIDVRLAIRSLALFSKAFGRATSASDAAIRTSATAIRAWSLLASHGKDHRLQRINVVGKGKTR